MKKVLNLLSVISTIAVGSMALAITVGIEPPALYINNLKTCTKSSLTKTADGIVSSYTIKELLPDGRCAVEISDYTDFSQKDIYDTYIDFMTGMAKSFKQDIPKSQIPTQAQMIEQSKRERSITTCKFTLEQRNALYNAYQKHDDTNPKGNFKRHEDGGFEMSGSFDMAKMSSYNKLMMSYSMGTCTDNGK